MFIHVFLSSIQILKKLGKNLYATFSSVYYFPFYMHKYNMYGSFL